MNIGTSDLRSLSLFAIASILVACSVSTGDDFLFRHHFADQNLPGSQWGQTALVDVDRDGDLDFITGRTNGDVRWYEYQKADQSWTPHLLGRDSPSDVGGHAIDVDRDGRVDFVAGGAWYRQPDDPKTEPWPRFVFDQELSAVHDIIAADLDGDDREEIVTLSDKSDLRFYRIPKDDVVKPWEMHKVWAGVHAGLAAGDLDGDGDVDLVRSQIWLENQSRGSEWKEHRFCGVPWADRRQKAFYYRASRSWVADINRDGRPDIILTENEIPGGRIAWFEAPQDPQQPNWKPHFLEASDDEARGPYHSLQLADFDGDGDLDIFAGEMEWLAVAPHRWFIWENVNGDGSKFMERVVLDLGLGTHETQAGDVDGDGDIDLVGKLWRPLPDNGNRGRNHIDFLENLSVQNSIRFRQGRQQPFEHIREPRRWINVLRQVPESQLVAIVGGSLIDGLGGPPLRDCAVIIQGNRIADIGRRSEISIPANATIFDATGKSVLPGLFDSHFHSRDSVTMPVEYLLRNGVTSFRDPGHPFKYYDRLLSSTVTIPRVFLCGGHLDAPPAVWPDQAAVIKSRDDVKAAIERHVQRGASAIKVYFRLPLEYVCLACETANGYGIPVTAHLELIDADDAILAGVEGIEHITSFGTAIASPQLAEEFKQVVATDSNARREWRYRLWARIQTKNNERVDGLVRLVVDRRVFVSPTLAIFESRAGEKEATPTKVAAFENMMKFFGRCHQAGAAIVVGSHTSPSFAKKGKAYLREMELMVEAGMQPLEVITAATKTNAEFFGVIDRLGTIEPGKLADLIIVGGDPAKNIADVDRIERVMLDGDWVQLD